MLKSLVTLARFVRVAWGLAPFLIARRLDDLAEDLKRRNR